MALENIGKFIYHEIYNRNKKDSNGGADRSLDRYKGTNKHGTI